MKNIQSFICQDTYWIAIDKNKRLRCYDYQFNEICNPGETEMEGKVFPFAERMLYFRHQEDVICLDIPTCKHKSVFQGATPVYQFDNYLLLTRRDKGAVHTLCVRLPDMEIGWEAAYRISPFFDFSGLIYGHKGIGDKSVITSFNVLTGAIEWEYDLEKQLGAWIDYDGTARKPETVKFIGACDNELWVSLNNGKILILDCVSGAKIYILENKNPYCSYEKFKPNLLLYDKQNKCIVHFFRQSLSTVNIKEKEIRNYDLRGDLGRYKIENDGALFDFDNYYIYFIDNYNCKAGVLERSSNTLKWEYDFKENDITSDGRPLSPQKIHIRDRALFILDNQNTLHVFVKEIN